MKRRKYIYFGSSMLEKGENSKKIMIVEDETVIAADLELRLTDIGYSVSAIADCAQDAIRGIEAEPPDLILMDIRIRGPLDGVALATHIRQHYGIPVIFLTAHADVHTLERAKITEPFGFLVKPLGTAQLPGAIEIALYKHKIEQELKRQKAWFDTTLRSIGEAIVVTDMDQRLCYVNQAAADLIGMAPAECLGRTYSEIFRLYDEATDQAVGNLVEAAMNADCPVPLPRKLYLLGEGGRRSSLEGTVAISHASGERFGAIVTFRDVTAQRIEEQERREEDKMIAVGRLATGIAASFQHVEETLSACADQLRQAPPGFKNLTLAQRLAEIAREAALLNHELIALTGEHQLQIEPLNLAEFVAHQVRKMRLVLDDPASLSTSFEDGGASLETDVRQLGQVLTNLILNARNTMSQPGAIRVRTSRVPAGSFEGLFKEDYLRIEVQDDGPGLSPSSLEHIFEPFFREPDSQRLFGLELATARNVVTSLGGFLSVQSEVGKGCQFEILLPKVYENAPSARVPA